TQRVGGGCRVGGASADEASVDELGHGGVGPAFADLQDYFLGGGLNVVAGEVAEAGQGDGGVAGGLGVGGAGGFGRVGRGAFGVGSAATGTFLRLEKTAFQASTEVELMLNAPSTSRLRAATRALAEVAGLPSPRKAVSSSHATSAWLRKGRWRELTRVSAAK